MPFCFQSFDQPTLEAIIVMHSARRITLIITKTIGQTFPSFTPYRYSIICPKTNGISLMIPPQMVNRTGRAYYIIYNSFSDDKQGQILQKQSIFYTEKTLL